MVGEYKLECYRKIKPLGSKGNLWLVEDSVTQNRFVMRRLSMELQEVYQRLTAIHHTNIVEIIDIFSCDGFLYVIEEYLEWKLLSDTIVTGKLSHRQVMSIGRQLFSGILVLHEHNIIHRDIKPENIMIDAHGTVKLIDFDIARLFAEEKNVDTTVKGSKDYAPPEQFGFSQTDRRTDIYSLGVTLNELAVGKLPEQKMCTGKLGIVIRRCIEFDPKRRYQNAAQALKHINRLEKRTALFLLSAALLTFLLSVKAFISSDKLPQNKEQKEQREQTESLFDTAEEQDRIIYTQYPDEYPAFLLAENKEYDFSVPLSNTLTVSSTAQKSDAQLTLSCALSDGDNVEFHVEFLFDDIFSEIYKERGRFNNVDFERTSPEYEILLDDINEDGTTELLVTLAWRCRIDTPDPEYRYYLTEYSTLWVLWLTDEGGFACSEPLYFNGCTPTLQTDSLIYDYGYMEWHTFHNGIWH